MFTPLLVNPADVTVDDNSSGAGGVGGGGRTLEAEGRTFSLGMTGDRG